MENEFPPNSHAKKEDGRPIRPMTKASEKEKVGQVTTNRVTERKKPLHKKFLEAFRPEDNKGFLEYVLLDLLVPGIKDTLADAAGAAIDNALGVSGSRSRRRGGGGGYTSYSSMGGSRSRRRNEREDDHRPRRNVSTPPEQREFILDTRVEANEVLDNMYEILSKYDSVTMRDLLSMLGVTHEFTDEDWGWLDLRGARIHRVRGGYLLDLPRPVALD